MTVNDYLARRDAAWMGDVYRLLGLSVASVQQGMTATERRSAYTADITYATQNEIASITSATVSLCGPRSRSTARSIPL